ncbi:hypothetical protein P4S72_11250 [Vibrio sp. PP-XX7]
MDEKDECGGDDFVTPLLHTPIWRKDKWMNWFGWRYRNLYYGAFETIEFDQNFPSSTVINKALRNYVSNGKSVNEQHRNIKSSLRFGRLGYDETSVLPVFMNALWLGVHFYNWRYGTGTNGINYHTTYFLFMMATKLILGTGLLNHPITYIKKIMLINCLRP